MTQGVCALPGGGGASRCQVEDEAKTFQRKKNQRRLGLIRVQKGQKLLESSADHAPGLAADSHVHLTEDDIAMRQNREQRRSAASLPALTTQRVEQHWALINRLVNSL